MKKVLFIIATLLSLAMLTACFSSTDGDMATDGSSEQNAHVSETVVQPNAEKQILSLAKLENSDAWRNIEVAETSNYIVFVHNNYFGGEQTPDQYETVVVFYDKQTGIQKNTIAFDGRYIENSLEYNKGDDTIQLRIIQETSLSLYIIDSGFEFVIHSLPADFAAENSMQVMQQNILDKDLTQYKYSFDGTPDISNVRWAVSNVDGIAVQPVEGDPNSGYFISNDTIQDYFELKKFDELPPAFFSDVRVMNNGKNLVATVHNPSLIGLYNLNLETGEEFWYDNVFSAMIASVEYRDDKSVVAQGDGVSTFIDLDTGEAETVQKDLAHAMTYDYENYFERFVRDGKGSIRMYNLEKGIEQEILAEFDTAELVMFSVTENFIVCVLDDGQCNAVRY